MPSLQDTARERVVLDGKEIVFWESPSDQPHSWHDELWATVEGRVMEVLVGSAARGGSADREVSIVLDCDLCSCGRVVC